MCSNNDFLFGIICSLFLFVLILSIGVLLIKQSRKPGSFQRIDIEHRERNEREKILRRRRGDA